MKSEQNIRKKKAKKQVQQINHTDHDLKNNETFQTFKLSFICQFCLTYTYPNKLTNSRLSKRDLPNCTLLLHERVVRLSILLS